MARIEDFIKYISVGKYNQGLFLHGRATYSTLCGGLFTAVLIVTMLVYSGVLLESVFHRHFYHFEAQIVDIFHWEDAPTFKIGDLRHHLVKGLVFYLDPSKHSGCESV